MCWIRSWYSLKTGITSIILLFSLYGTLFSQGRIPLQKFEIPEARLVFYDKNTSYLVPHTVKAFRNALDFHKGLWGYKPSGETNILFNDFTDIGNGGTMVLPWNYLNIAVAPFDYTFSVVPSNERMQWLMSHELAHQVMCDKSSKGDDLYRKILGGKVMADNRDPVSMFYSYMTTPRWYCPRWYHEGIAVFAETWMSGGVGRVMGGYDEMVFRSMVLDSAYFYNVVGLETEGTTIDFQVGVNSYLYGTRFDSYLAYVHGIPKLKQFYSRTDSSNRFYASQFRKVYDVPVQKEWDRWIAWEHEFQNQNLEVIRKNPVTACRPLTAEPLGSVSSEYYDSALGKLIMAVNYPGKLAHIASLDLATGKMEKISPVASPGLFYVTSLAYDDSTGTIFASTNNKDWRGLQAVNIRTRKIQELEKISRTGNLVYDKTGHALWGIQSMSGRTSLVRFLAPYTEYRTIITLPYGQEIFDPAISPDGKLLSATHSDVTGRQQLVIYDIADLLAGKTGFRVIYEFEDNPASNFVFSPDGNYLYGTSYYTGVSNIYRISLKDGKAQILSNAETGFFRPLPVSADSMIAFRYTHKGMVPVIMKIDTLADVSAITYLGQNIYLKSPEVADWILPSLLKVKLDSSEVIEKRYLPVSELKLAGAYPIVQGYKDYWAFGYRINLMDPMGLNSLRFKLAFTVTDSLPRKQIPHISAEYSFWNWTFSGTYNYADFYDLFGPTKFSRAGYSFSAKYYRLLNRLNPWKNDFYIKLTMYGDMETLPDYQNIASDYRNFFTGVVNYHRSFLRKSLGAIEPEQGYDWNVFAYSSLAKNTFYPQLINNFDVGFLMPLRNSSLWFRTSVGQSFGPTDKTNSYFYFGGFGNNYIDYRPAQQYREMSSFPGMQIDAIEAMNYTKLASDLNLTPIRFRKFGFRGLYPTYTRFTLFGMGLFTNLGYNQLEPPFRGNYYSVGIQADMEIVLFSLLKSTLSAGYSKALNPGAPGNQFMISLKLM